MNDEVTDLDFDVIREPWSKYQLLDGTKLGVKVIAVRIIKLVSDEKKVSYSLETQLIHRTYKIPERLRGKPAEQRPSRKELESSIVEDDIRYDTLSEEWNEYMTEDGAKVRIKNTVSRISRTNKYNKNGEPIYLVSGAGMVNITPPKVS